MSTYDAIVVGSGMSGGWVAKELCERGLKVLVLERGNNVRHRVDYTDNLTPWQEANVPPLTQHEKKVVYPIQSQVYAFTHVNKKLWVKDNENPYETAGDSEFKWYRGYHVGGRSLMWNRQSYRLSQMDFEANKKDGHGVDWPIRYEDLAPWYDHVETFAGISGTEENIPHLPDSKFLPPFELNCMEREAKRNIEKHFPDRTLIAGRTAHLRKATKEHQALGRVQCQVRSRCENGCTFGAYFSSQSATLPAAERTGNLTLVTDAIVQSLQHNEAGDRITGVHVIDQNTHKKTTYSARLVFLNASAVATAMILLNSRSKKYPNGLANSSDMVGRNVMDHVGGAGASASTTKFTDRYFHGRRPNGIYIPRYVNMNEQEPNFVRGFGIQGGAWRHGWQADRQGIGQGYKNANRLPGSWTMTMWAFGEVLPNENNRITLNFDKQDQWGMPLPVMNVSFGDNEKNMMAWASKDIKAMMEKIGFDVERSTEDGELNMTKPGELIHEMGTARMGRDPKTSVLNEWSQSHDIANLFITDGACMTSSACQNPSLTYMALSARAANYAADLFENNKV